MLQMAAERIFLAAKGDQLSVWLGEPSQPEPHLNSIDAGIRPRYSGVGNMHEAHLCAPITLAAQKMNPESAAGGEIDV